MSGTAPTAPGSFGLAGRDSGVRYEVLAELGSGGMATVQYGRLRGPHGFVRSVAIKRLHPHFAKDPEFVKMFIDEARLSARLAHANIVATLDVIDAPCELALVMEYVHGESLWTLLELSNQRGRPIPVRVAAALAAGVLHGLHAAHEARDEHGRPLDIVHRDVSPHNILVGSDGVARLIDFGVAKAVGRLRSTPSGEIKGKLVYMAPEQLSGAELDRRADVYGAAAVLWEALTGCALFDGPSESSIVHAVLHAELERPSRYRPEVPNALDAAVMRGLARDPTQRFASARDMALELERRVGLASQSELADWLQELAGDRLAARAQLIASLREPARNEPAALHTEAYSTPVSVPASRRRQLPGLRFALSVAALIAIGLSFLSWRLAQRRTAALVSPQPSVSTHAATEAEALQPSAAPAVPPRGQSAPRIAEPHRRSSSPELAEPRRGQAGAADEPRRAADVAEPRRAATPRDTGALPSAQALRGADAARAAPAASAATEPRRGQSASGNAEARHAPAGLEAAEPRHRQAAEPAEQAEPASSKKHERPALQPTAAAECTPWFYVDEAGIRRPKPGCL